MTQTPWYPARFNFGRDVVDHFAHTADGPALIWTGATGDIRRFSFSDISRLTARLASSMVRAGIAKGDRVIVLLPRIPEWQIAMVACLKIGAVPVPCIEMLTGKDLAYRIEKSGAAAVIARAEQTEKFVAMDPAIIRISVGEAAGWRSHVTLLDEGDENFQPAEVEADDPAILYFTSGSTGQPKGVLHASRALYLWRQSAIEWLDLTRDDLMWCTADTGWSKAGTSILFGPWSCGTCTFFYDGPFDAGERLRLIERHGVTVYCASSTELLRLLDENLGVYDLSKLRRTVSAGETLSRTVVQRWRAATGHDVAESYGQTESLMSLGYRADTPLRAGSTGQPLGHNDVRIITDGRLAPDGTVGDVALRAPNPQLMVGYWNEPARTDACYVDGPDGRWFVTGDRGRRDSDGFIYMEGRSDDVINSAGYRIGPAEVEDVLLAHPAVAEAAVVGGPDAQRGEIVVAFVVLRAGYEQGDALVAELQQVVKQATAPYKYPRAVHFVTDLPKTLTGKIQRNFLRESLIEDEKP